VRKPQPNFKCPVCSKAFYLPPSAIKRSPPVPCCSWDCKLRRRSGLLDNADEVQRLYGDGKSLAHIRRLFGGDSATIAKLLRDRGVVIRSSDYYSEGERNGRYKGGSINEDGYRVIYVNGKTVFEHRKIMEDFLQRRLGMREHVHHMNGNKLDNRIENLAVLTPSIHGRISAKQYHDWRKMYQARVCELEVMVATLRNALSRKPQNLGLAAGIPVFK
jgi:hypothetical protein